MMLMFRSLLAVFIALLLAPFSGSSQTGTTYVTLLSDSYQPGELRWEIQNAGPGDTVLIDVSGTVVLNSTIGISTDLTIIGPAPIHFTIDGGIGTAFNIGGGIVSINGIKIINSTTSAIVNYGNLRISRCVISGNLGLGAIKNYSNLKVESCSFLNNTSSQGGAVENKGPVAEFFNCTFYNNQSTGNGGAIYNMNGGALNLINNTFHSNSTSAYGGAVQAFDGSVFIQNNIFYLHTQGFGDELGGSGMFNTGGGNVFQNTFPAIGVSWMPFDYSFTEPMLSATAVIDGYGLEYFTLQQSSPCIDIGNDPGITELDARRVWRIMDGSGGVLMIDAGAVEYSPFTVNSLAPTGAGTFDQAMIDLNGPLFSGKKAIVFEHNGGAPYYTLIPSMYSINEPGVIINGFSQNGSSIPGPVDLNYDVTPGFIPIEFDGGGFSNPFIDIPPATDSVIIAGLSITGYYAGISTKGKGTIIEGCHIGVDADGTAANSNDFGIEIAGGAMGGAQIGAGVYNWENPNNARNVISGNAITQIEIWDCKDNVIQSNFIGSSSDGVSLPLGTIVGANGINILASGPGDAQYNIIGGYDLWEGNLIVGQVEAITVSLNNTDIAYNYLGSDFEGYPIGTPSDFANDRGIVIDGMYATDNYIEGNIIGNTNTAGINLSNNSMFNYIAYNYLGLAEDGVTPLPNLGDGILIDNNSTDNIIGGVDSLDGNFICYSGAAGISYQGMNFGSNDSITGNFIGLDTNFNAAANAFGILIGANTQDLYIGNTSIGYGNEIANNLSDGVRISPVGVSGIVMSGNSMYNNTGLGIELDEDGPSLTTGTAPVSNNGQIPPNLLKVFTCPGNGFSTVSYEVDFAPGFDYQIEFFIADAAAEEGEIFLGSMMVTPTVQPETFFYNLPPPVLNIGDDIVATATKIELIQKHTSEFSASMSFNTSAITVNAGADATICPGDAATLVATVTGATGSETYLWSNGVVTASMSDIPVASPTTYFVDVFDAGCTVSDTVIVTHFAAPAISITGQDSTCVGDVLSYNVSGGFVSYSWSMISAGGNTITGSSTTSETATFNNPGSDTLWVDVQDVNSCWWSEKLPIEVFASPVTLPISATITTVCEFQTGTDFSVTLNPGNTYNWTVTGGTISSGQGTNFIIVDWATSGTYSVSVTETDPAGCSGTPQTTNVTVVVSPTANAGSDTTICEGSPVFMVGTATGGTGPYTFSWDNSVTDGTNINPLATTTYTVTATDAGGCVSNTDAMTITVNPKPVVTITGVNSICAGQVENYTVSAFPTVTWNFSSPNGSSYTGSVTSTESVSAGISSAAQDSLFVTVTDANSCSNSDTLSITITPGSTVSAGVDQTICANANLSLAGSFTIAAGVNWTTGGSGSFSSITDPNAIYTPSAGDISTGSVTLTLTTTGGSCSPVADNMLITITPSPVIMASSTDITCNGFNDGMITITTTGGASPYQYSLDGGTTYVGGTDPYTFFSLSAATYNVIVMDANSCLSTVMSQTIIDPVALAFDSVQVGNVTCNNFIDGTLEVFGAVGGTPIYDFSIDGGSTYQAASNFASLAPGTYTMVMEDQNGCQLSLGIYSITQPSAYFGTNSFTDASCNGLCDGAASTAYTGGYGIYTYDWYDAATTLQIGQTNDTAFNLCAGTYYCIVLDNGLCPSTSGNITIGEPAAMVLTPTITDPSCANTNDGSIVINVVSGGTAPYQYSIDNGTTLTSGTNPFSFNNLSAGPTYTPYVMDASGCFIADQGITLTNPSAVILTLTVTNESCFGAADGEIVQLGSGGAGAPYDIDINGGGFVQMGTNPQSYTGLSNGYSQIVIIRDANGCTDTATAAITGPSQISYSYTTTPDTCSQGIGTIVVTGITGGTGGPYGFSIDNGNTIQTSNVIYVFAGTYNLIVGDLNNCVKVTLGVTINDIIGTLSNAGTYPGPTICPGESTYIQAYGGSSYNWITPGVSDPFSDSTEVTPDSSTFYTVEITSGGCMKVDSTFVGVDAAGCAIGEISNNVFTPDGDEVNDVFMLDIPSLLQNENSVKIYNRWGDLINEYSNYNNTDVAWDGNNRDGNPVTAGTYFYVVEIPSINYSGSGWVQVVR